MKNGWLVSRELGTIQVMQASGGKMNPMTEAEILGVIFELVDAYNSIFEFWLSGTFAFVLSLHFGGPKIGVRLGRFLFWLYACTSTVFILRFVLLHVNIAKLNERIASAGYEGIADTVPGQGLIVSVSTFAIMFTATIGALAYAATRNSCGDNT